MKNTLYNERIRNELISLADQEYQFFSSKLLPGINNILGVRLPILRKLAKKIANNENEYDPYLAASDLVYFEEVMLQGMVIGYVNLPWLAKAHYVERFIPHINNWSVCDSFCNGLKIKPQEKESAWQFLQPYVVSTSAYDIRFAVVMMLSYFVEERYARDAFIRFDQINHDDYYVKMAVAWAVSIYFRDLPDVTMTYLQNNKLDNWTHNKALQKITESLKVDNQTKIIIRNMKRKTSK